MTASPDTDARPLPSLTEAGPVAGTPSAVKRHPFIRVARTPGVARILVFWLLAFMPVGMNSLASVLTLREYRYSFADTGAVVGVYLVGMAAMSPFAGRLMDRAGLARVLIPCAIGYTTGVGLLLVLASRHAPLAALCAASLITGAVFPRVTSALRVRWPNVMPSVELRDQAYLLEATLSEAGPIVGAVLVAVLASTIRPAAALMTSAAFALVGTVGFVTSPAARRRAGPRANRSSRRPLGIAGIRALVLVSAAIGGAVGAIEVAAPVFTEAHGSRALAGLALSACGLGSVLGGIVLATRLDKLPLPARYRRAVMIFVAAFCLPVLAHSNLVLIMLFFAAGFPFSLVYGTVGSLVSVISPEGSQAEAFSVIASAMAAGGALGVTAAGFAASHGGPAAALGTAACLAAVTLVTTVPSLQRRCGLGSAQRHRGCGSSPWTGRTG
jgi:predicted MFS family arabinose efflux permease